LPDYGNDNVNEWSLAEEGPSIMWRGKVTFDEMRREQIRMLEDVQGYRRDGDVWIGRHYNARITDRPGLTAGDARGMGISATGQDDEVNCLVIEYFSKS
jgi:hypothetical protein